MKLTLAMGANHTSPENLVRIINQINKERMLGYDKPGLQADAEHKIIEQYRCDIDNFDINVSNMSYAVEEKYDGYSYLNSEGRFFSKRLSQAKGNEGIPVEKTGHIPHLALILRMVYEACGADLHGELYKIGGISDDVTKILGCTEDEALNRQRGLVPNEMLHYMLIDIRAINGFSLINEPHRVRRAILKWVYEKYIKPLDTNGYIRLTEELCGDPRDEFKRIVRAGGEGIIIKSEYGLYIPGKKPANNWIKGKKKITHDVVIMGFNAGTGKNAGLFGSIRFGHMIDGKLTECGNCSSGLSDDMRAYIYNNADRLIADKQVFEIEAIQESVKSFRNAVFLRLRNDKDWSECTPVNVRVKEDLT
jgi:ATP-dependent DNA ligase